MIQQHYKISSDHNEVDDIDTHNITQHEGNALRYAAGYVCRQIRKKIERGKHALKEELILCLMSLTKGGEFAEANGTDEEWLNAIDRGGLWHVRENTYSLFCALETQVQTQLKSISRVRVTSSRKSAMIKEVVQSDDVQFYWIICRADFEVDDEQVCNTLLFMITELYITVRGFAYASIWIERYKQETKKPSKDQKASERTCTMIMFNINRLIITRYRYEDLKLWSAMFIYESSVFFLVVDHFLFYLLVDTGLPCFLCSFLEKHYHILS